MEIQITFTLTVSVYSGMLKNIDFSTSIYLPIKSISPINEETELLMIII